VIPATAAVKKDLEEKKEALASANPAGFEGVDEEMELDEAENQELMKFETIQTSANPKEGADIEFDKIKISDVRLSLQL
jgi:hypothetical protein